MNDDRYLRTIKDLEEVGSKWWPKEVRDEAMKVSILQYLLDTQVEFICLLTLADRNMPEKLFTLIDATGFEYHLFLKHLILLTDVGSEPIQRFNSSFTELFPDGKLEFAIGKQKYGYHFTSLPTKGVPNNKKMQSDTLENLTSPCRNTELCKDLIMLLIYGAASTTSRTAAVLYKCNAFEYIGDKKLINEYVRQNYIRVSHIEGVSNITKWLLRTIYDNLSEENDEQLVINIGESTEILDVNDFNSLKQDLISNGYEEEELFRSPFCRNKGTRNCA